MKPPVLPVLDRHLPDAYLGRVEFRDDGRAIATFEAGRLTVETLVGIGGGWRLLVVERVGREVFVRRAELITLSTTTPQEGRTMPATTVNLGDRVKDRVTGFKGIVVATTEWLNGCRRVGVQPEKLEEGKPGDLQWFDEPQVDIVAATVHVPFAAEKPAAPLTTTRRGPGGPRPDPTNRRE